MEPYPKPTLTTSLSRQSHARVEVTEAHSILFCAIQPFPSYHIVIPNLIPNYLFICFFHLLFISNYAWRKTSCSISYTYIYIYIYTYIYIICIYWARSSIIMYCPLSYVFTLNLSEGLLLRVLDSSSVTLLPQSSSLLLPSFPLPLLSFYSCTMYILCSRIALLYSGLCSL